jgi:MerR, DNA binding
MHIGSKVLGLKLDEIKQILLLNDRGQASCERTQAVISNKITEIEQTEDVARFYVPDNRSA